MREKGNQAADRLEQLRAARTARTAASAESADAWELSGAGWPPVGPGSSATQALLSEPVGEHGEVVPGPPRRTVRPAAAVAAAVLALLIALVVWMHGSGSEEAVQLPPRQGLGSAAGGPQGAGRSSAAAPGTGSPPGGGSVPTPSVSSATATEVVVDVEGRVRRPGLQRLPSGSRVADAVRAAGGTSSGAVVAGLNLARLLVDGEQVLVPGPGDPPPAAGAGAAGGAAVGGAPGGGGGGGGGTIGSAGAGGSVDLNTATTDGLDTLPGVGPVLAGRIVAWRTEHGRFSSVDELAEVPGIGPKLLERLRPLVRI